MAFGVFISQFTPMEIELVFRVNVSVKFDAALAGSVAVLAVSHQNTIYFVPVIE